MRFLTAPRISQDALVRCTIFVLGFSPIASLSLSTFNLIPLYVSGPAVVLPAIAGIVTLGLMFRHYSPVVVRGFFLGVAAVFLYDLTCRFPFMAIGIWHDFIPKIGNYLLHREHVHWSVGYLWRYVGNGVGIFCCLLITIYLSPSGRTYLFDPTPLTATLGLLGHIVFGATLGFGTQQSLARHPWLVRPVQLERPTAG